jgi:ATP-dependent helicase/DNAse subunit B
VAQEAQKPLFLPLTLADGSSYTIQINGKIDRIDKVGDTLRIIDYKTGKDELSSPTMEGLFDRTASKSTKALMQVFVYALMYLQESNTNFELGIYKLTDILSPGYIPEKDYKITIKDYEKDMAFTPEYLNRFKELLAEKLATLFDINTPFTQTTNTENCKYCEFKPMCGR